jgi:hypothetical protein
MLPVACPTQMYTTPEATVDAVTPREKRFPERVTAVMPTAIIPVIAVCSRIARMVVNFAKSGTVRLATIKIRTIKMGSAKLRMMFAARRDPLRCWKPTDAFSIVVIFLNSLCA